MCAGADKEDLLVGHVVDEKPIGLHVAFPNACPIARELVRPEPLWEHAFFLERPDNGDELLDVPTASLLSPDIPSEPRPLCDPSHGTGRYRLRISSDQSSTPE